jgi:class 3 adenylate cyclase
MDALAALKASGLDIPFLLISGSVGEERAVEAMKAGAQDCILKDNLARLGPALRRELHEAGLRRSERELKANLRQTEERLTRLKRFFSPQVAELALSGQVGDPFQWHRKDVTVLFIDLRGFTGFVEVTEPEAVIEILQEYYTEVGKIVQRYGGTIGHVAGDGIMVFLNDPIDIPNPQEMGVLMALDLRELLAALSRKWAQMEYSLHFGAGIASGFATIGGVGAEGCWDYSIFGTVTNLASRLCERAVDGQILISRRFLGRIEGLVEVEAIGQEQFRGMSAPVSTYNVLRRVDR